MITQLTFINRRTVLAAGLMLALGTLTAAPLQARTAVTGSALMSVPQDNADPLEVALGISAVGLDRGPTAGLFVACFTSNKIRHLHHVQTTPLDYSGTCHATEGTGPEISGSTSSP